MFNGSRTRKWVKERHTAYLPVGIYKNKLKYSYVLNIRSIMFKRNKRHVQWIKTQNNLECGLSTHLQMSFYYTICIKLCQNLSLTFANEPSPFSILPYVIVPRQILETLRPELPRKVYSTAFFAAILYK